MKCREDDNRICQESVDILYLVSEGAVRRERCRDCEYPEKAEPVAASPGEDDASDGQRDEQKIEQTVREGGQPCLPWFRISFRLRH